MNTQQLADILAADKDDLQFLLNCIVNHFKECELDVNKMNDDMIVMIVDTQIRKLLTACKRLTELYKMTTETRHEFCEVIEKLTLNIELERDTELSV